MHERFKNEIVGDFPGGCSLPTDIFDVGVEGFGDHWYSLLRDGAHPVPRDQGRISTGRTADALGSFAGNHVGSASH